MRLRLLFSVILLTSLLLAACSSESDVGQTEEGGLVLGRAEVQETVRRGVVPGNRALVLESFSGEVRLEAASGETAELRFVKRARGEDDEAARERLSAITIDEQGGEEEYVYTVTSDAAERTSVDVRGTVPAGTRLRVRQDNGTVVFSGLGGPLDVQQQNGSVRIEEARGDVTVETQNGAVEAGLRRVPPEAQVDLRTQNGDVTLALPAGASAQVDARTEAGQVSVDGLRFDSRQLEPDGAGARFTGQLGDGNAEIALRTQNGSITLRERTPPPPDDAPAASSPADSMSGDSTDGAPSAPPPDTSSLRDA